MFTGMFTVEYTVHVCVCVCVCVCIYIYIYIWNLNYLVNLSSFSGYKKMVVLLFMKVQRCSS